MANPNVVDRDLGWRRIAASFRDHRKPTSVTVGVQAAEGGQLHKDPDAKPGAKLPTNAMLATVHEFGNQTNPGRPPERSFMRSTFDENVKTYQGRLDKAAATDLVDGTAKLESGLMLLGEKYRADIIKKIRGKKLKPLADSTLERRKGDTPLLDTGQLIGSLRSVVKK